MKSVKNLWAKILLAGLSIYASFYFVELIFKRIALTNENTLEERCGQTDLIKLSQSRLYPFSNFHYQPMDAVEHCSLEWNYTYHTDENGLRISENAQVQDGLLAVGDSFTFGFGVEDKETFASLLGAYNGGVWSAPFNLQFEVLKRDVELFKPKTVIWSFYPAHIISMMPGDWDTKCPGDSIYFSGNSKFSKAGRYLIEKHLLPLWENSYFIKYVMKSLNIKDVKVGPEQVNVFKNCYATKETILYDRNLADNNLTSDPDVNASFLPERDAIYNEISGYFRQAKELADTEGFRIYFVIIPSRLSLTLREKNSDLDYSLPTQTFTNILKSVGVDESSVLDLSRYFQEKDWRQYYFKEDAHWNASGHKFVADAIKNWMKSL